MWLGTFQLGEVVPIDLQTVAANDVPTDPSAIPTLRTYAADGTLVDTDLKMPRFGVGTTGLFRKYLFLDSDYAAGKYCVRVSYTVTNAKAPLFFFEILPGGNTKGAYRALSYYDKTGGDIVVGETDTGELELRVRPYL